MSLLENKSLSSPRLAITIGDPAGIGPEVVLKALVDSGIKNLGDFTIIGCKGLLNAIYQKFKDFEDDNIANPEDFSILDIPLNDKITLGKGDGNTGAASFKYLDKAISRTLKGEFDGIVTAPIAKSLWKAAGHNYPGQTEVLASKSNVDKFGMLFVGRSPYTNWTLRTLLATTHIPLAEVSTTLNPELMSLKLDLLIDTLRKDFGIQYPKIVISGLNPHSGEDGQLGTEEKDWLFPWLEKEQKSRSNVNLMGLVPPDTMWVKPARAWYGDGDADSNPNPADAYLALYHDQGLIPVKLMAFDYAINTTIGLPFIRTSPDHGTAFDIADQGIANPTSMKEAIKLAAELCKQRMIN